MSKRNVGMNRLDEAGFDKIEPVWGPERERAVRAAIAQRAGRRQGTVRTAAAVTATALLAVGGFAVWTHRPATVAVAVPATIAGQAPAVLAASEAVSVTALTP